jgi:hypothetical protein
MFFGATVGTFIAAVFEEFSFSKLSIHSLTAVHASDGADISGKVTALYMNDLPIYLAVGYFFLLPTEGCAGRWGGTLPSFRRTRLAQGLPSLSDGWPPALQVSIIFSGISSTSLSEGTK